MHQSRCNDLRSPCGAASLIFRGPGTAEPQAAQRISTHAASARRLPLATPLCSVDARAKAHSPEDLQGSRDRPGLLRCIIPKVYYQAGQELAVAIEQSRSLRPSLTWQGSNSVDINKALCNCMLPCSLSGSLCNTQPQPCELKLRASAKAASRRGTFCSAAAFCSGFTQM